VEGITGKISDMFFICEHLGGMTRTVTGGTQLQRNDPARAGCWLLNADTVFEQWCGAAKACTVPMLTQCFEQWCGAAKACVYSINSDIVEQWYDTAKACVVWCGAAKA
jgi:hypothetical protein